MTVGFHVSLPDSPPPEARPSPTPAPGDDRPWWRRALPFATAIALTAFLIARLDLHAFARYVRGVHAVGFLAFCTVFSVALVIADCFATSFVFRRTVCPISFRELLLIRGASYLPSLLNHHVGQAWLTWYLSRVYKAPLWRVAGATLLNYATTFAALLLFGFVSLLFEHNAVPWLAPVLAALTVAGVAYLALLAAAPPALARRQILAPLFEVGIRGHLQALVLRIPHMLVLFAGTWIPFAFFNIRIPAGPAFAYIPILMVIVALPVTPQGVGTRDWFALHYFARYGPGTLPEQEAAVAASTLTFVAGITLVQAALSLLLMRRAIAAIDSAPPRSA
jgi:hypothetical protein